MKGYFVGTVCANPDVAFVLDGAVVGHAQLVQGRPEQLEAAHPATVDLLAAAAQVDRQRRSGEELGPLAGVPIAVKDNLCTRGLRTTCASKIIGEYVPPYDAHVVEALRKSGAVIVGKLHTTEFACFDPAPTTNPWNARHTPGGSSAMRAMIRFLTSAFFFLGAQIEGEDTPTCHHPDFDFDDDDDLVGDEDDDTPIGPDGTGDSTEPKPKKGCGNCAATCPCHSAMLRGFKPDQLLAQIGAA